MSNEPPVSEDSRRLIVAVREYLAHLDAAGNPYGLEQRHMEWVTETIATIRGEVRRRWYANPRFMEYGQTVGEWRSETVPGVSRGRGSSLGGSPLPGTSDGTAAAGRYTVQRVPGPDSGRADGNPAPAEQGTDPAA